jgi:alkylation response protein AidB-like acyl-CoA dehydrogenase
LNEKFDHLTEYLKTAAVGGRVLDQVPRHAIMGMIGGGTNEIHRNVIAQRRPDLPR